MVPDHWNKLTSDQKFSERISRFIDPLNKSFVTSSVADRYRENAQRFANIVMLKEPDRVPRLLSVGDYLAQYSGLTRGDFYYHFDQAVEAAIKFNRDFDLDFPVFGNMYPGRAIERLGYQLYHWPGQAQAMNQPLQFIEGEYMRVDEYNQLLADPEGFFIRTYMPRVYKSLTGWQKIPSILAVTEIPFLPAILAKYGESDVQDAFRAIIEAGTATNEFTAAIKKITNVSYGELGLPFISGGFTKAPFDFLGDSLRGTRGIILDMYRNPDMLITACEHFVPLAIQMAVDAVNDSENPFVMIPLHKGGDEFMSLDEYKRFYWPTLKAVIMGLIDEGAVPFLFVEGKYNQRLNLIAESGIPAGKTIWMFDQTDMRLAKKFLGGWACIGGNVPALQFAAGTPDQMETQVKQLIDQCAPGGGYFISTGAAIDEARLENVHTFLKVAKEYGVY